MSRIEQIKPEVRSIEGHAETIESILISSLDSGTIDEGCARCIQSQIDRILDRVVALQNIIT